MDDAHGRLNEIDRALAEALDVAPSPDFVARVRQRVAREPRPVSFWHGWKIAVPALAAAAMVAAIGLAVLSRRPPATQPLQARSLSQVNLGPVAADAPRAVAVPAPRTVAPSVSPARAVAGRREPVWHMNQAEPEVLVPREEIEMYRRLLAAAQTVPHAVVVESPKDIVSVGEVCDLIIEPIKIEPIAPPSSGRGERQ